MVNGEVDLCVAPSESVISCWTSDTGKVKPIAVAALLQHDMSSIASLKSGSVQSLADLSGKRYASYGGRFEMAIIRQAVANSNGDPGSVVELLPPKLDCLDWVTRGNADATWIFSAWEGVIAKRNGIEINEFQLKNAQVPYGYSPVILAHPSMLEGSKAELLKRFLKVCQRSYKFCQENPTDAAKLLFDTAQHPTLNQLGLPVLIESQELLAAHHCFLNETGNWGVMKPEKWNEFVTWLLKNNCLTHRDGGLVRASDIDANQLYTNAFLSV